MRKFEYKELDVPDTDDLAITLNVYGEQGWQVINYQRYAMSDSTSLLLMREKATPHQGPA